MKKFDLIFKFLFLFTFVNISYGQVGPYFGGATCDAAVPIEIGEGFVTNNILGDDWYSFEAPCDGYLEITHCDYGDNKQIKIYSGICESLVTEKTAAGDDCSTNDLDGDYYMLAGETVYIQMDDTWDEDDIVFDVLFDNPACAKPFGIMCYPTDWNILTIAWFAGGVATNWSVTYGPSGFDPDVEGVTIPVAGSPLIVLTDLDELTCYDIYILPICGGGIVSCMNEVFTCCTSEMCPGPTTVTPSSITSESFDLSWAYPDPALSYEVEYGLEGFASGTGTTIVSYPDDLCNLTDLAANECYDVYIRSNCGVDIYSSWKGPFTVCTLVDSADLDIKGTVYLDENGNGIQDPGEEGINLASILSDPEGVICFTDTDGQYATSTLYLADGVYEIYPFWEDHWVVSSDSLVYTIINDISYDPRDSLDFGLYPDELIYEVTSEFTSGGRRCNDTTSYWLTIQNSGTTIASGLVHLELDDSLYYVSANILPDSVVGQHIYWHYEDLFYFDHEIIHVRVGTPDGFEDAVSSTLTVSVDTLDIEVYSTVAYLNEVITCAYDPNDKTPDPLGEGEFGNIPPSTEKIEYLVRFQNTGTDTAFNVVIRDQLDPNLNWHSLNPLAYSHDMSINISFDGEVSFIFNDIMLPDSNVNEAASQGFVKYEIKLNEDLPLGTSIHNTANIYFDYNPAIVTNTTVNTLYLDDVSIAEITNQHHILVYPNPFSESTTVYFGEGLSENCSLHIVDLLGNQVYFQDRVTGNSLEINASTFTAGVYILVVQDLTTSEVYTKKMVVN